MEVIYMVDLKKLQKEIYQNKVNKGFNVTDIVNYYSEWLRKN